MIIVTVVITIITICVEKDAMGRAATLRREQVFEAANGLKTRGVKVSTTSIREALGDVGSYTSISTLGSTSRLRRRPNETLSKTNTLRLSIGHFKAP